MAAIPIALQMYTVRDDAAKDFVGVLRQVAEIGYAGVELAGNGGLSASELKSLLGDLGLKVAGSHVGLAQLEGDLSEALDYNYELGNRYVVCPWLPEDRRSAEGYRALAQTLNTAGADCKERGMQLCYHNHAFELERFGGETGLDILFGVADPELVKVELDTYWVEKGGESAAEFVRKYAGRVPLVHLKDMTKDESQTFAEVGEGSMDFGAIFSASEAAGVEWYIVEQDTCRRPPLESIRISFATRRRRGKV
jgi:sugar phosphate isomerase/epimerase